LSSVSQKEEKKKKKRRKKAAPPAFYDVKREGEEKKGRPKVKL